MSNYQELHNRLALATSHYERCKAASEAWGRAKSEILHHLQAPGVEQEMAQVLLDDLVHSIAANLRLMAVPALGSHYRASELRDRLADMIEPQSYKGWTPDDSLTPRVFTATLVFRSAGDARWIRRYTRGLEGVRTVMRTDTLFLIGTEDDVRKAVAGVESLAPADGPAANLLKSSIEGGVITSLPGLTEREGIWAYKALLRFKDERTAKWAQKAARISRPDFTLRQQYVSLAIAGPDMDSVTQVALDLKQRFGAAVELWQGKELATRRKWGL